jgi:hypothetical protein
VATLKKGMGSMKKKKNVFKNKIETDVPNKKKFGRAHEFRFTNIKTVLQKYVLNKPLHPGNRSKILIVKWIYKMK